MQKLVPRATKGYARQLKKGIPIDEGPELLLVDAKEFGPFPDPCSSANLTFLTGEDDIFG